MIRKEVRNGNFCQKNPDDDAKKKGAASQEGDSEEVQRASAGNPGPQTRREPGGNRIAVDQKRETVNPGTPQTCFARTPSNEKRKKTGKTSRFIVTSRRHSLIRLMAGVKCNIYCRSTTSVAPPYTSPCLSVRPFTHLEKRATRIDCTSYFFLTTYPDSRKIASRAQATPMYCLTEIGS